MSERATGTAAQPFDMTGTGDPWARWAGAIGIPIHRGHHVTDLRTVEVGWWAERRCKAAFVQLVGQESICEGRVTEIDPGATVPPMTTAVDELVYVLAGHGATTIRSGGGPEQVFEWGPRSLFVVPRYAERRYANLSGDVAVRLFHYSYLPLAMNAIPEPDFFFRPFERPDVLVGSDFYSRATMGAATAAAADGTYRRRTHWTGNFFPDMGAWDQVEANYGRGAGGTSVRIKFPGSELSCHMSVFDPQTYKKAHRHGPGRVILIPAGEGYSVMWEEGRDRIVIPWHEGSAVVPPDHWFHQHFNVGAKPARYLALHPPPFLGGYAERIEDRARDQIEYPDEDPFVREKFAQELGRRGLVSLMPERAYRDRDWEWLPGERG
jgi:oxalate decarboxylase/phosphoglucose isomerase-like protein (cupin superfamily)